MFNDLRYALRMLLKSPGFTAVAVISLALGIGANTAIFSALNAVLLRSLPVKNPQELRLVNWIGQNPKYAGYSGPGMTSAPAGFTMGTSFSYAAYCALRDRGAEFADLFTFSTPRSVIVVGHGQPTQAAATLVSGNYFSAYGADVLLGRPIVPDDERPGANAVAVITYRWWEHHCGLRSDVIGQAVSINGTSFTVVGVLPRHHLGPTAGDPSDIYVPISSHRQVIPNQPLESSDQWQIMARLAPGALDAQSQARLAIVFRQAQDLSKTQMENAGIVLEDGSRGQLILRRELARPFYLLTAIAGLVLLIACANLAGLLLARGEARRHEMAVRAAVGAGRWRLIRQSMAESLVLAILGAGLGAIVASISADSLLGFLAFTLENSRFDFGVDTRALLFTLGVSLLTALISGILPAIRASRADPATVLKARSSTGARRPALGKALVSLQVGLSVLVVIGAGLLIRTFANLARVKPGFDARNVLLFRVRPSPAEYEDGRLFEVFNRIRGALAAVPGVKDVSFANFPLVSGSSSSENLMFSNDAGVSGRKWLTHYHRVGEDFFRTMDIPLLAGRDFGVNDTSAAPRVAIINETFARLHFPGENPIGRTFTMEPDLVHEIIGVVGDTKYNRVRSEIPPLVFASQRQSPTRAVSFTVRSSLPPMSIVPAARDAVAGIDPNLPLSLIRTQDQVVDESVQSERLFASLGGALAGLAMLLSCIGLYGLMAYNVARRTPEFGIRMALGATRRNIAAPIVREAFLLAAIGLCVGLPAAVVLSRLIQQQLYAVSPNDPLTLVGGSLLLIGVAMLSAWLPARRASRVDPMVALRSE